jgi:hypothetical protein
MCEVNPHIKIMDKFYYIAGDIDIPSKLLQPFYNPIYKSVQQWISSTDVVSLSYSKERQ